MNKRGDDIEACQEKKDRTDRARSNEERSHRMFNKGTLSRHELYATGTTGTLIEERTNLKVQKFKSGPLGGDQQIGAKIAEGEIDILIFFWDPLEPLAHDVDIKALIRLATVYNIPVAINRSTADFLISSPLFEQEYEKIQPDYETQLRERIMKVVGEVKHSD
jgi:methylglyoxal synthase